jgi:hypothetical protein
VGAALAVLGGQQPAATQRDAERAEVIAGDHPKAGEALVAGRGGRVARPGEVATDAAIAQRKVERGLACPGCPAPGSPPGAPGGDSRRGEPGPGTCPEEC